MTLLDYHWAWVYIVRFCILVKRSPLHIKVWRVVTIVLNPIFILFRIVNNLELGSSWCQHKEDSAVSWVQGFILEWWKCFGTWAGSHTLHTLNTPGWFTSKWLIYVTYMGFSTLKRCWGGRTVPLQDRLEKPSYCAAPEACKLLLSYRIWEMFPKCLYPDWPGHLLWTAPNTSSHCLKPPRKFIYRHGRRFDDWVHQAAANKGVCCMTIFGEPGYVSICRHRKYVGCHFCQQKLFLLIF